MAGSRSSIQSHHSIELDLMISQTSLAKLAAIIFPITGTSSLVMSVFNTFRNYIFISKGLKIEGEIISLSAGKQPIIEFLPTGRTKLVKFSSSGLVDYKIGDHVTVLYLRDSNPYFMINTTGSLLLEPIFFAAMGILHLKLGLGLRKILR